NLITPEWIAPYKRESLPAYAERFVKSLGLQDPYYLGGASFGGIMAQEMAKVQPPLGLFLISSTRSPAAMTAWLQKVSSVAHITQILPWQSASLLAEVGLNLPERWLPYRLKMVLKPLHHDETDFMRWGLRAVLRWRPTPGTANYPVHQIHGELDPFLPARQSQADIIVPGAGHLLTKSHAEVVNQFLLERLQPKPE
ncbi:MAG TPA: alpha/beta hydrolase, partial [Gemmatales bacterium]|nr:alpha/beta hydrolase [Gemmatales bacterium]